MSKSEDWQCLTCSLATPFKGLEVVSVLTGFKDFALSWEFFFSIY
jgi:hypothetical protein